MANSRISQDCISAASDAFRTLSSVDLEKYVTDVINKARSYDNLGREAAIDQAIKDIGDERAQSYLEQMQLKVNDKAKVDKLFDYIVNKKKSVIELLARRMDNLDYNVESSQRYARGELMKAFMNRLTADETSYLINPNNSIEIMRALDGKEDVTPIAKSIAKKLDDYRDIRNSGMVNSGAMLLSNINKARFLRALHDPSKLLRAGRTLFQSARSLGKFPVTESKRIWKAFIIPLLDLNETFRDTDAIGIGGVLDMDKVNKYLDDIFNNIIKGKPLTIGKGTGSNEMFFYWKDNESWMKYSQKYGRGNLYDAINADINASANKIGMARIFGSDAQRTYNAIVEKEVEHGEPNKSSQYIAKNIFLNESGLDPAPHAPYVSNFFNALRGLSGTSKLAGRLTLVSTPDISNGITFAKRYGYDYFKAYGTYLGGLFNAFKTEERKYLAGMFKEIVDTHLGFMGRYMDVNNPSSIINKFNNGIYRITLMDALDKGNKLSAIQLMARLLGDNAKFAYEALNPATQKLLDKFNINPDEWDAIRKNTVKFGKNQLITMDSLDALTNDDIKRIYGIDNDMPLYQLKNNLYQKVYSMFDVASENTVLTPGEFTKGYTRISSDLTPVLAELLKSMMQFKMYPLEFMDRTLYQGMKNADGIQNKLKFAALLAGATLPMSWLSNYLDNIFRGKSQPDWDRMSLGQKTAYATNLLFPGLSMFGSFLDPNDQTPQFAEKFIATPAMKLLGELIYTPATLVETGFDPNMPSAVKEKKIKTAFKNLGESVIPGQGFPFLSPYMRQMFGDKPYLQPGQRQIFGD